MFSHRHLTRLIMGGKVSGFVWFYIIFIEFRSFILNNKLKKKIAQHDVNGIDWVLAAYIYSVISLKNVEQIPQNLKTFWIWRTFCNLFHFWNNFQALKYNLWAYKQWEFLLLIKHSLNIAIIQLHGKKENITNSINNYDHSVECQFCTNRFVFQYFNVI